MRWGLVHQQQDLFYNKRFYASSYKYRLDFVSLARAFGMKTFDMEGSAIPEAILKQAICEQDPCLLHVPINLYERVYPMVPPGAPNREMIEGFECAG